MKPIRKQTLSGPYSCPITGPTREFLAESMRRLGLELVRRAMFVWFADILVNGVAGLAVGQAVYLG